MPSKSIQAEAFSSMPGGAHPQPYMARRPSLPVFPWHMAKEYYADITDSVIRAWCQMFGTATLTLDTDSDAAQDNILAILKECVGVPWGPGRVMLRHAPFHTSPWNSSLDPSDGTTKTEVDRMTEVVGKAVRKCRRYGILPSNILVYFDCEVFYDHGTYTSQQLADRLDKYAQVYTAIKAIDPQLTVMWYAFGWCRFTGGGSQNADLITPTKEYPVAVTPLDCTDRFDHAWYRPDFPTSERKCYLASSTNLATRQDMNIIAWVGTLYHYGNASEQGYRDGSYPVEFVRAFANYCKDLPRLKSVILYPGINRGNNSSAYNPAWWPHAVACHRALTTY